MSAPTPVTRFEHKMATMIVAATIVMASSFSYFFVGSMPIWIALGIAGLGLGLFYGRAVPAWKLSVELRRIVMAWLSLILVALLLDVFGDMPRDIMSGAILNLVTLFAFFGLFCLATVINHKRIIVTIFVIAACQGILGIAQFFGSDVAWRFPDTLIRLFPNFARLDYDSSYDVLMMSFDQVGRVRGSLPFVHVYNQIQSVLVSFCVVVAMDANMMRSRSWVRNMLVWSATLLGIVGSLLSFSRSGILAILGVAVISLILNPKPSRILFVSSGSLVILLVLAYFNFSDSSQFFRLTRSLDEGISNLDRRDQYNHVLENFLNNPLTGASGPNGRPDLLLPIHSVPLRYLNDYGLVGFMPYMFVFLGFAVLFIRRLKSISPVVVNWASCGLAVLLVVMADSWTHSSGFLRRDILQTVMLGLVAGAMLAAEWRAGLGRT